MVRRDWQSWPKRAFLFLASLFRAPPYFRAYFAPIVRRHRSGFPAIHAVKNKLAKTRSFSLYGFGAEGFVERALGSFKNRFGLLASDVREACQKIFERMTALEIIKQAFDGNASPVEAWGVARRVRIDPDNTV